MHPDIDHAAQSSTLVPTMRHRGGCRTGGVVELSGIEPLTS